MVHADGERREPARDILAAFGPPFRTDLSNAYPGGKMPEILTESFCERCGTRYTFEAMAPAKAKKLGRFKTLSKGLKNYVLSDESSLDEALASARSDEERVATSQQLEAFQATFNFCMTCRQYTCANCWNSAEGACLTCAPFRGLATLPTTFLDMAQADSDEPIPAVAAPWPTTDVSQEAAAAEAAAAAAEASRVVAEARATAEAESRAAVEAEARAAVARAAEARAAAAAEARAAVEAEAARAAAEVQATRDAEARAAAEAEAARAAAAHAEAARIAALADAAAEAEAIAAAELQARAIAEAEARAAAEFQARAATAEAEARAAAEAASEPAPAEAEAPAFEAYVFEQDIAPSIAELESDEYAALAARRTTDLLARLRPVPSNRDEAEALAVTADAAPVEAETSDRPEEAADAEAAIAAEFGAADYVIADYEAAQPAPEESIDLAPWPDEPAAELPPELLAVIGPPIGLAPEPEPEFVGEPVEAAAETRPTTDEVLAEPADTIAADLPEAATPVLDVPEGSSEPEPVTLRTDVVEQPTWQIVAPDVAAAPTNGHTPQPDLVSPAVVAPAPIAPPPATVPQWPTHPELALPAADPTFLLSRRTADSPEAFFAAPVPLVVAQKAATPVLAVQTCGRLRPVAVGDRPLLPALRDPPGRLTGRRRRAGVRRPARSAPTPASARGPRPRR